MSKSPFNKLARKPMSRKEFFGMTVLAAISGVGVLPVVAAGRSQAATRAVGTAPGPPSGLTVVGGDEQLRITWVAPSGGATSYQIFVDGSKVADSKVTSIMIDQVANDRSHSVSVAAVDSAGAVSPKTASVSDTCRAASFYGAPVEVASFGPNGTHYPDRTPWIHGAAATVLETDCTWAAIKAAVNSLTDAQVNAGARINIRPGTLPGNGAAAGSRPMMDTVGELTWRRRVLLTPRDGAGSVKFSNNLRVNKMWNVALVGFDLGKYAIQLTGCSYSALAWTVMASLRLSGLNGMLTEGFDLVEWVIRDVAVGDLDPAAFGSGYSSTGNYTGGNSWLRYCRSIAGYIAPKYLPVKVTAADGTVTAGYGHNDSLQLYGNGHYYGFTFRDSAHWGSNNSALQAGGWSGTADPDVGPIPYFMRLSHTLLINAGVASAIRYPTPANAQQADGGSAINGNGRNGQHYADQVYTTGSLYRTNWQEVSDSRCTVAARPSTVGAWTQDNAVARWTKATWDRICPIPTAARTSQIWSKTPPSQSVPAVPALGATS
jgi:hypothetical protein